jgi:hypothetical protein
MGIHLAAREVWSGKAAPGLQIGCKRGVVWLTQSDDPHDHILHPGQRFSVTCHGKVVVQALTAATIFLQMGLALT